VGGSIHSLGDIDLDEGDIGAALDRYREAQPLLFESGSTVDLELAFGGIAAVAALSGRKDVASRLWGASQRIRADADRKLEHDDHARYERAVGAVDKQELEAGRALSDDEAVALAQETADALAATRRSSSARTWGQSSSTTL
jgi:hypothetical protein